MTVAAPLVGAGPLVPPVPSVPSGSRRPGPTLATLVALVVAGTGLVIGLRPLSDNSYLTHVATGRLIVDTGRIPTVDGFSFTADGQSWVVQSWLASVAYGIGWHTPGHHGLVLLHAATTVALALAVWRLTQPAGSLVARVALVAASVGVGAGAWSARPLTFGLLLLAAAVLVARGDGRPWWVAPLFWIWVNTHGSFPLGLVALAVLAAGEWADGRQGWSATDSWRRPASTLRWALVGTVAGAVNPLGPRLLTFPLELLSRQDVLADVIEWQAPRFVGWSERAFLVLLVLAIVGLTRRPRWSTALPSALFTVTALLAARNVAVASLVLLPGAAAGLAGLGSLTGAERRRIHRPVAAALALVGALLVAIALGRPAFDLDEYPVNTLAELRSEGDPRIAAPEVVGNYQELAFGVDAEVFYDDRFDMYPQTVSEDYVVLVRAGERWQEVLDRYRIDVVVWPDDQPLTTVLDAAEGWDVGESADPGWIVARRSPS